MNNRFIILFHNLVPSVKVLYQKHTKIITVLEKLRYLLFSSILNIYINFYIEMLVYIDIVVQIRLLSKKENTNC